MVDFLCKYGIHIDNFRTRDHFKIKLFLLTHGHHDHAPRNVKTFSHPIYCSKLTSLLVANENVYILEPNTWYQVRRIRFYVFETLHCPGSIGFFFPKMDVLFLGDTRISTQILNTIKMLNPKTILYDNTHQLFQGMFPSLETSAIMVQQTINSKLQKQKRVYLCLPHIGTILLIHLLKLKVRLHPSLKADVIVFLETMKLVDCKSQVVAVGMKWKDIHIMPSSQYFVVNQIDPHQVVDVDNHLTRVFASFHAGHSELGLLGNFDLISLEHNEE